MDAQNLNLTAQYQTNCSPHLINSVYACFPFSKDKFFFYYLNSLKCEIILTNISNNNFLIDDLIDGKRENNK